MSTRYKIKTRHLLKRLIVPIGISIIIAIFGLIMFMYAPKMTSAEIRAFRVQHEKDSIAEIEGYYIYDSLHIVHKSQ